MSTQRPTGIETPRRDPLLTVGSLKALAVLLVGVWLFWPDDTQIDRERLPIALVVATCSWAVWRLYRWHSHPFSGASEEWLAGERERYTQRQLAQRDNLLLLTPQLFEDAIAQLLRVRYGWEVHRTKYSDDGGWDINVRGEGQRMLVECKQYQPDKPVGRPALQKLHSAMVTEGVQRGILVTTSVFSEPAREFAAKIGIRLIDGQELARLMRDAYRSGPKSDVVHMVCTRCGALVEFSVGQSNQATCTCGHPVTNDMASVLNGGLTKQRRPRTASGVSNG